jgi:hypothetical protein
MQILELTDAWVMEIPGASNFAHLRERSEAIQVR